MIKSIVAIFFSLLLWGCSPMSSETEIESMDLHLGGSNYTELVDFLYGYAGDNRLNVLWFGWYQVDDTQHWYERSDEDSNFKIKLALLAEENGYLFISNHFDETIADVVINYGDKKTVWIEMVDDFKKTLAEQGWRLEDIKDTQ